LIARHDHSNKLYAFYEQTLHKPALGME
jgi:hypothetical protein